MASSRQIKRLDSVSRSLIYSHFGESVQGALTIRAFAAQRRFTTESQNKVDANQTCHYHLLVANRSIDSVIHTCSCLLHSFMSAALFVSLHTRVRNSCDFGTGGWLFVWNSLATASSSSQRSSLFTNETTSRREKSVFPSPTPWV